MAFDTIKTEQQQMQSIGVVGGEHVVQVLKPTILILKKTTQPYQSYTNPRHFHIGDPNQIEKDKAIRQLKEAVDQDVTRPIKRMYEAVTGHRGH